MGRVCSLDGVLDSCAGSRRTAADGQRAEGRAAMGWLRPLPRWANGLPCESCTTVVFVWSFYEVWRWQLTHLNGERKQLVGRRTFGKTIRVRYLLKMEKKRQAGSMFVMLSFRDIWYDDMES